MLNLLDLERLLAADTAPDAAVPISSNAFGVEQQYKRGPPSVLVLFGRRPLVQQQLLKARRLGLDQVVSAIRHSHMINVVRAPAAAAAAAAASVWPKLRHHLRLIPPAQYVAKHAVPAVQGFRRGIHEDAICAEGFAREPEELAAAAIAIALSRPMCGGKQEGEPWEWKQCQQIGIELA